MSARAALDQVKRIGTGLSFIVFPLVWVFAFALHPGLLQPRLLLGPQELILRAHGNGLLQLGHVLVTLDAALLVPISLHFMRLLDDTPAAWTGTVGAVLSILGAFLLAAEKGALCLAMSALDTLPDKDFAPMLPGLVAIFSFKGWMALTLGLLLMPLGTIVQGVGLWREKAVPRWQSGLLLASLLGIAFPDGSEIINLTAAVALSAALAPYGVGLLAKEGRRPDAGQPLQPTTSER
mgnify:CR=1 FL=1